MSVGAALAAPERQVINLQADGSALYTLQVGVGLKYGSGPWLCSLRSMVLVREVNLVVVTTATVAVISCVQHATDGICQQDGLRGTEKEYQTLL